LTQFFFKIINEAIKNEAIIKFLKNEFHFLIDTILFQNYK